MRPRHVSGKEIDFLKENALLEAFFVFWSISGDIVVQIDTIWLFIGSFLMFLIQAGFAMVESRFTRAKNAANLIMKNLMDFSAGALLYFAFGFGLMYGASADGFIGTDNFFLSNLDLAATDAYSWVDFLFQTMFAATTATIVSGSVAECLKFNSYLIYSVAG